MELSEFLLARIAEDEAAAREAGARYGGGPWIFDGDCYVTGLPPFDGAVRGTAQDPTIGRHIARHDPARVLAECGAKRRIVEEAVASDHGFERPEPWGFGVLRLLVLPYADHPDYREEWRP